MSNAFKILAEGSDGILAVEMEEILGETFYHLEELRFGRDDEDDERNIITLTKEDIEKLYKFVE